MITAGEIVELGCLDLSLGVCSQATINQSESCFGFELESSEAVDHFCSLAAQDCIAGHG